MVHGLKLLSCGVQPSQSGVRNIKASQFSHLCCVPRITTPHKLGSTHPSSARVNRYPLAPHDVLPLTLVPAASSQPRRALIPASLCVARTLHACMIAPTRLAPSPPPHAHLLQPAAHQQLHKPIPKPIPSACRAPRGAFTHRRCRSASVITAKPQALKVRDSSLCLSAIVQRAACTSLPVRLSFTCCGFSPLQSCTRETPAA